MINPVSLDIPVQVGRRHRSFLFKLLQIYGRSVPADFTVTACRDRCLVHNAVPLALVVSFLDAVVLGKDVVDVYLFVGERGEVHFCSGNEIAGMVLEYKSHHAFVGGRLTGLQAEQTHRIEVEVRHCLRKIATVINPLHDLNDVVRISGFVCRAVQFTENAAQVPLFDYVLDRSGVNPVAVYKNRADSGKGDQLRAVREIIT